MCRGSDVTAAVVLLSGGLDSATALALARETGDTWATAWTLHVLGRIAYFGGMNIIDASSRLSLEEAEHLPLSAGLRAVHVRLLGRGRLREECRQRGSPVPREQIFLRDELRSHVARHLSYQHVVLHEVAP